MSTTTQLCVECGDAIESDAEVCPTCGARQEDPEISDVDPSTDSPLGRETRQVAERSKLGVPFLGLLLPPLAYYMVGRTKTALACFFTMNFLLLGHFISPVHTYLIINNAQSDVKKHG